MNFYSTLSFLSNLFINESGFLFNLMKLEGEKKNFVNDNVASIFYNQSILANKDRY